MSNDVAIRTSFSVVAVAIGLSRWVFPDLVVDSTTAVMLIVAMLPWLGAFVDSVELTGIGKVSYRKLDQLSDKIRSLPAPTTQAVEPIRSLDDRAAIAEFNIRLRGALESQVKRSYVDRLIRDGSGMTGPALGAATQLSAVLDGAIQQRRVQRKVAEWVRREGPDILARLGSGEEAPAGR